MGGPFCELQIVFFNDEKCSLKTGQFENREPLNFKMSRPKKLFLPHKSACLTGPGARLIWTLGLSGPQTQNPKPLKPRTQNHWSIACLRVSENILISSLHFYCLLQILQLIEPQKMSSPLDFTHVFGMETSWNIFIPMVFALALLCTPKFYPKYSKFWFFCPHPKGWTSAIFYVIRRSWLFIQIDRYITPVRRTKIKWGGRSPF